MRTKAISVGVAAICASSFALECFGGNSNVVASEVNKAASESLKTYRRHGIAGMKGAVSECWVHPRDFCLYLDVASQRIAASANRSGTAVDKYFFTSAALPRAHAWLSLNARGPVSNVQYLYAVEQMMDIVLSTQQEKAIYSDQ
ncbi:hypothetical protein LZ683_10385 [Comamonas testosteroni]|uniref:hypothetical protein n=1 Tax=Comamonas testosteroni TaxID=285 RepID=UPI0023AA6EDB|nr:hypothetical protein [Comamonas testosteroni]WEE79730.1 hypothetical protein LZ683_10385 [Comamonas testosteroni]